MEDMGLRSSASVIAKVTRLPCFFTKRGNGRSLRELGFTKFSSLSYSQSRVMEVNPGPRFSVSGAA